jgi:hypothetical protein
LIGAADRTAPAALRESSGALEAGNHPVRNINTIKARHTWITRFIANHLPSLGLVSWSSMQNGETVRHLEVSHCIVRGS